MNKQVRIEVCGGSVEVVSCPKGVEVVIADYDNDDAYNHHPG